MIRSCDPSSDKHDQAYEELLCLVRRHADQLDDEGREFAQAVAAGPTQLVQFLAARPEWEEMIIELARMDSAGAGPGGAS